MNMHPEWVAPEIMARPAGVEGVRHARQSIHRALVALDHACPRGQFSATCQDEFETALNQLRIAATAIMCARVSYRATRASVRHPEFE